LELKNQKQANIYDVARLAKVSHQTVSRAINNSPSIKPLTRAKVEQAMAELGYVPNQAARALASAKSKMLGILASDTGFGGPASMVREMELAARASGYFVVTCAIDPSDIASVREGIEHFQRLGIEGLAMVTPHSEAVRYVRQQVAGIPVVTLESTDREGQLSVEVDNFAGALSATKHLLDLGHKKILHVSGPANWFESSARSAGYRSAMEQAGLEPNIVSGDWSSASGFEIAQRTALGGSGYTAVFLANDKMALGLLHSCRIQGIAVPEDLSVIGFDDLEEAQYSFPPLTTVRQDFKALGERAMELLLGELSGNQMTKQDRLTPKLVVRESTSGATKKGSD
jgi:DNA-binding LacI/PurR family transcriptional regulator